MWTTAECYAPNATADAATDGTGKEEHATTRKTRTNETDSLLPSCPPNTLTHGEPHTTAIPNTQKKSGARRKARRGKKRQATRETRTVMVFGDNVRARRAARALPRTPAQEEEGRERRRGEDREDEQRDHATFTRRHSTVNNAHDITHTTITCNR